MNVHNMVDVRILMHFVQTLLEVFTVGIVNTDMSTGTRNVRVIVIIASPLGWSTQGRSYSNNWERGGGGGEYSYILVLPDEFLLIFVVLKIDN